MREKKAFTREIAQRYRAGSKKEKHLMLEEFVKTTGYNRKYAIHLLSRWGKARYTRINGRLVKLVAGQRTHTKRSGRPFYDQPVKKALRAIWEMFDYMCGKRLAVLMRMNMALLVHQPELNIDAVAKEKLLRISPATIDRILKPERTKLALKGRTHTRSGPILKHQIPIRTSFDWDERKPGFFELDTVGHDGGSSTGEFCFTLNATDVSSGWVELRALQNRAQRWVKEAVQEIRSGLPFPLKGIDSDNGGEFINRTLFDYCSQHGIVFTRARSYRKNDNCFVEQKNDLAVRRTVGYYRFDTPQELDALTAVYAHLCPLLNFYYPSMRLIEKIRIGAKIKKVYDAPKPPFQRLIESADLDASVKKELHRRAGLIHIVKQKRLVDEAVSRLLRLYEAKKQKRLPF